MFLKTIIESILTRFMLPVSQAGEPKGFVLFFVIYFRITLLDEENQMSLS